MDVEVFLRVALAGFSGMLFAISLISYARVRNSRLLFISAAFAVFFVKGLVLTLAITVKSLDSAFAASVPVIALDFVILVFIYLGIAKPKAKLER
jgi:hypothetical protein